MNSPTASAKHSLKALARRWRHLDTEVRHLRRRPRRPHHPGVTDTTKRIRHRSRPRGGAPHRVRRQPRTDPLRSRIRETMRHLPHPSVVRTNQPAPPLPRRAPTSQRSPLPTRHRTNANFTNPPSTTSLDAPPKASPKKTSSAASNASSPARSTNTSWQTTEPDNTPPPPPEPQYLTIGASTPPPSRSSAPSKRNSSTGPTTTTGTRPACQSVGGSKPGTTPARFTPPSDNSHQTNGRTTITITRPHKPSVQHTGGTPGFRLGDRAFDLGGEHVDAEFQFQACDGDR